MSNQIVLPSPAYWQGYSAYCHGRQMGASQGADWLLGWVQAKRDEAGHLAVEAAHLAGAPADFAGAVTAYDAGDRIGAKVTTGDDLSDAPGYEVSRSPFNW